VKPSPKVGAIAIRLAIGNVCEFGIGMGSPFASNWPLSTSELQPPSDADVGPEHSARSVKPAMAGPAKK